MVWVLIKIFRLKVHDQITPEYHVIFREDGSHYYENDDGDTIEFSSGDPFYIL